MSRTFELLTPLGPDALRLHRMHGREEMARLGEFEIDALSEREDLDPDAILGKKVAVRVEQAMGPHRVFSGHATRFSQVGVAGRFHLYRLTVRPWLWFLTRTANCRIFQQMKVPDILKQVFDTHGDIATTEFELTAQYREWEYCVQYRETDFDFVSRLMEQEGIYYYFRHEGDKHTMVLADSYRAHDAQPGCERLPFLPREQAARAEVEHVSQWSFGREIQPVRYVHDNFDPEKPRVKLQSMAAVQRGHELSHFEVYDYPDKHTTAADGEFYARVRLEELQSRFEIAHGETNSRGLAVGHLFHLFGQPRPDQNREYLVLGATYQAEGEEYESSSSSGARWACSFTALPSQQPFRPARRTPKPIVQGPQTAIVVGPAGEEIYTDAQGRVKVRFHWDRYSAGDENSSCWIRVSQPWAGKGWGGVSIPRIGQEVIVDFIEGDPDRPIITGRVYNAELMPPYAMPGVVSGLKSQTHKGAGYNELAMDDTAGKEMMNIHAQYDMATKVLNDQANTILNNQTNTVQNNRTTTVQAGNDTLTVVAGTRTVTVKGDSTHTVQSGSRAVTVQSGDYTAVAAKSVVLHGQGKGVNIQGDAEGVAITGNAKGVTIVGNDEGLQMTGNAKGATLTGNGEGVTVTGNGQGVTVTGNAKGVTITGNGEGVHITGNDQGTTVVGKGKGVLVDGQGEGVTIIGAPVSQMSGTSEAKVFAPTIQVGDGKGQVTVAGAKVVLTAGGATITLDASGITLQGTIAHIN
ncbi:type VI secretion system Vgr family protein [Eleftheria terrae]|uniref:type VI secretion system Vgr family protein n=1 Tax=Eleftheria terrae TaxID=1597781 RepID=UPI00263ACB39|nr:type VI secretion system tip protein TssI/VgrG [Eleftheria terrae]WKB53292.1 type VI secretion system tip protein VgrG [Eleftheria terrae]